MTQYITDSSTNLNETLLSQENIYLINTKKCELGNIMYELDTMVSNGNDIVYLCSDRLFDIVSSFSDKITKMHSNKKIIVINVESSFIGKNNLSLKLIRSKNLITSLQKYNSTYKILSSGNEYSLNSSEYSKIC